ncbi:UDP-3-O-acyl-N-acetylglucosamine deacetylase [Spirochaetota bacterium]
MADKDSSHKILIIDDEENIQKSLSSILLEEGFGVDNATDPDKGIKKAIYDPHISLVILDIWMPKIDGIKVLERIRKRRAQLPVLIISGHASIDTAVKITKIGADDFLEKPFSSDQLLTKIKKLLHIRSESQAPSFADIIKMHKNIYSETDERQKTIKKSSVLCGQGLHSGIKTGIICSPLPVDSGIVFEDVSTNIKTSALYANVKSTQFATSLAIDKSHVMCIEHLMAVFQIYEIDNILVHINGEIPIFDGSAKAFCKLIQECGIKEQDKKKRVVKIKKEIRVTDSEIPEKFIQIEPYDHMHIEYFLKFPRAFGEQKVEVDLIDKNKKRVFKKDIAPARTFGFVNELKQLQKAGFGSGGNLENFILLDKKKVINTKLRFKDEFARHKILDILGDMYLLGAPFCGKITAHMSGHRDNINLVKKIIEEAS